MSPPTLREPLLLISSSNLPEPPMVVDPENWADLHVRFFSILRLPDLSISSHLTEPSTVAEPLIFMNSA
jgi:hypothetical protein